MVYIWTFNIFIFKVIVQVAFKCIHFSAKDSIFKKQIQFILK